ncbi:MAG: hypothetical protein GYA18_00540 [Chloroflexi bacterium]|nr:hypothetical protein [Chloroflexota bacterium]
MKRKTIFIIIGIFLLPIVLRTVWYYRGIYRPSKDLQVPDFVGLSILEPELSTPFVSEQIQTNGHTTVVFDQAHSNQYLISEIEAMVNDLLWQDTEVVTLTEDKDLSEALKSASAFVSIAPTKNFSDQEVQTVQSFVERGGRLLVIADPTRSTSEYISSRAESVQVANKLLEPYHLAFRNDYAYNIDHHEGNFRNVFLSPKVSDDLTKKIDEVVFYAARTISSYETSLIGGDENTLSSLTDTGGNLSLAALAGDNVLAIGDFTFLTSPYFQVADNFQFITNINRFLISGERQRTFADFPYFFSSPVGVYLTNGISLDNDLLQSLDSLKAVYTVKDLPLDIVENDNGDQNLIVLGLIPPNTELEPYLVGLNIQFGIQVLPTATLQITPAPTDEGIEEVAAETTPTASPALVRSNEIYIAGLGQIPHGEYSFFLLKEEENRTILIILADNQNEVIDMLDMLASGDISNCYTEGNIALCKQNNQGWKPTSIPVVTSQEVDDTTPTATSESQ